MSKGPKPKREYCTATGKPAYSKKGAQTARNGRMKHDHKKLRIYACDECDGWHLTSVRKDVYESGKNRK